MIIIRMQKKQNKAVEQVVVMEAWENYQKLDCEAKCQRSTIGKINRKKAHN